MALRDRQLGGIPLSWEDAFVVTGVGAIIVYALWNFFWAPYVVVPFFGITEDMATAWGYVSILIYIGVGAGLVKTGTERAQLFCGTYTGISFPAGIYVLPTLPFPVAIFLLRIFLPEQVFKYLGWTLEGDVRVESLVFQALVEGLSSDGVRVRIDCVFRFEIVNAAIFLSQTREDTNRDVLIEALKGETISRLRTLMITPYSVKELYHGSQTSTVDLVTWINERCDFSKEFGVSLARDSQVSISILNPQIERIFDQAMASTLLAQNAKSVGEAYKAFKEANPSLSDEIAMVMFLKSRGEEATGVDINLVTLK
jgi:hypothetical protein